MRASPENRTRKARSQNLDIYVMSKLKNYSVNQDLLELLVYAVDENSSAVDISFT